MRIRTTKGFFISLGYLLVASTLLCAQTPSTLPKVQHVPTLDGRITAHEWPTALSLGSLQSVNGADCPQTQAWMGWSEQYLLIAVRSREPQTNNIKTSIIADEKDGNVAADDCIQVLLDLSNSSSEFFQFIANTAGTYYDAQFRNGSADVAAWDSNATVRTHIGADYWEMEIAIPRHTLPQPIQQGDVIGLNIGRNRYAGGTLQTASLNKSAYANVGQYLKKVIGGPVSGAAVRLSSVQRGPFYQGQNGVWKFEVHSTGPQTVTTRFPLDAKTTAKTHQLKPGLNQFTLEVPAAQLNRQNSLEVQQGDRTLYATQIPVRMASRPSRVAITEKPLFRELMQDYPAGLSREGALFWGHDLEGPPHPLQLARRLGFEYSHEKVLSTLGKEQAIVIRNSGMIASLSDEAARNSGVKIAVLLDARAAREKGAPLPQPYLHPWWQDPRTKQAYLEDARKSIALAKNNPQIWGLLAGDETWEVNDKILKWFLDNGRETYPELMAADREIKEKYGFGLPESSTDKNPFRWIATRRWEADQKLELAKQVRDLIKTQAPHLRWVSWDNMAGHYPFALGRWKEHFDIITGQLYPARDATRQNTAFNTQFLADISGGDEVWPVLHVEHYPTSFTVAETEELLSQTFRSGATGLHLFPSDTIGRRAKKGAFGTDRIGAPERWNVLQQALNTLKSPFRVQRPVADTAIFYSNTSYQGQPELQKTLEPEWIYTILGPRLQSAVRFIDETFIANTPYALQGFKTIYVPYAPIVDEAEFDALQQFVAGGGTLVVNDPLAFRHCSDGTAREGDALLPPLSATIPTRQTALTALARHNLKVLGESYQLSGQTGEAIARYADGSVAAIQKSIGKGKVLFFGTNAIVQPVINNQQWIALFREIQTTAGAKLNQDVWRFRFPATPPFKRERPAGVCLTGNHLEWQLGKPVITASAQTEGHYLLSRKSGEAANHPIAFGEGRLTDRLKAAGAANDANPADFELQWTLDEPVEITYQFPQPVDLRQARFFFARTLPAGSCWVSIDGQSWNEAARWDEREVSVNEVALHDVKLAPGRATQLKVRFNIAPGKVLRLSETEIWGE